MTLRYSNKPSQKQLQVSNEIKKVLSQIFASNDIYAPELQECFISITEVRISPDLGMATVFFSNIQGDSEQISKALNGAAPELRYALAQKGKFRATPELRFVHDDTIDNAMHIESLLKQ